MDAYATHIEPLVQAALDTTGDILELGCGDYSTPILEAIAKHKGVKFSVKASDPEWSKKFNNVEVVDWNTWKVSGHYGLIFLDNELHSDGRVRMLIGLLDHCDCLVMHDASQAKSTANLIDVLGGRKYSYYDKHDPATITIWP